MIYLTTDSRKFYEIHTQGQVVE